MRASRQGRVATWVRRVSMLSVAGLVVAACGAGGEETETAGEAEETTPVTASEEGEQPAEEVEAGDPIDLRFTLWSSSDAHLDIFNEIADDFIAQHDRVTSVSFDSIPFGEYESTVAVQLGGGSPPDAGWSGSSIAINYLASNRLADLGPAMAATEGYDRGDLVSEIMAPYSDGDAVYAYPFSNQPFAVLVNLDLIDQAGGTNPLELYEAGEWTWETAADLAEQVANNTDAHGINFNSFNFDSWLAINPLWNSFDAIPWSQSLDECTLTEPEMVEVMTFLNELIFDRGAHARPGQAVDFFAGDVGLAVGQMSAAGQLGDVGFEWEVVPIPAGPAGDVQTWGQATIVAFADSDHPDAAAEFVAFMTKPDNAAKLAAFFPPPRTSLLTPDGVATGTPLSAEQKERTIIRGVNEGRQSIPQNPNLAQLDQTLRIEFDALWNADADIPAVLDQACSAIAGQL